MTHYFFCGIGGSGMSSIAQVLLSKGHSVSGSDRAYDQGHSANKFDTLKNIGCILCPQDGSGVTSDIDILVVSSAVEETVPDVKAALTHNVKILKRSDVLAGIFNDAFGIAIGGTSGKSTVTAMIGHVLTACGKDPSVINGAQMKNAEQKGGLGNAYCGQSNLCVIEADESDGSIEKYTPAISVLNNITLDHKPMHELVPLFKDFVRKASVGAVINLDDAESMPLKKENAKVLTYSLSADKGADIVAQNIKPLTDGVSFSVDDVSIKLKLSGKHNVSNALASLCTAKLLDIPLEQAANALASFEGVKRRMDILGTAGGVTVIDDFAHNPDKIEATLSTLQEHNGRILAMYQPHGFTPTKMLRAELVESFAQNMKEEDILLLPEIYFAGGTVERSISSQDLVDDLTALGKNALFFNNREEAGAYIKKNAKKGDRVLIMGARDDTLTTFAKDILDSFA